MKDRQNYRSGPKYTWTGSNPQETTYIDINIDTQLQKKYPGLEKWISIFSGSKKEYTTKDKWGRER